MTSETAVLEPEVPREIEDIGNTDGLTTAEEKRRKKENDAKNKAIVAGVLKAVVAASVGTGPVGTVIAVVAVIGMLCIHTDCSEENKKNTPNGTEKKLSEVKAKIEKLDVTGMKDGMAKKAILFAKEHTKNLKGVEDWKNVTKEFIKTKGVEMLEEMMIGLAHILEKALETGELVTIDLDAKEAEVQQLEQPKKEVKVEVDQHDIDLR
ncbi:hypothetical protein HDU99_006851 [Rhizoclosmatium hyalinum]|nr:hypothetical protein HDU99_006851 [Rhizoclosmatium hyalinum]